MGEKSEIERLRAVLTLVQNIVFDAVEDVSTNRADGDTRFERAIIDLDVMLNGGDEALRELQRLGQEWDNDDAEQRHGGDDEE